VTLNQPPLWIESGCYSGEGLRAAWSAMTGNTSGVLNAGDLLVTTAGAMFLNVAAGSAFVAGTERVGQGSYFVTAPSANQLTVAGANPTNPRIDVVVARVYDPAYGVAVPPPRWALEIVQGTPAASPLVPTLPSNSLALAQVRVNAGVTTITGANITDVRTVTVGALGWPPGVLVPYAGTTAPQGFLLCQGQAVSRSTYAGLFAVIGTLHGTGDGSTTFNVPDLRGRVAFGYDGSQTEFNLVGKKGGAKTVTATTASLAPHSHPVPTFGAHSHGMNNSPAMGAESAVHTHDDGQGGFVVRSTAGSGGWLVGTTDPSPGTSMRITYIARTLQESPGHNHSLSNVLTNLSGGFAGLSTSSVGSGAAVPSLNPYVTIQYVIKT
jgi:microcystin-dependent protein